MTALPLSSLSLHVDLLTPNVTFPNSYQVHKEARRSLRSASFKLKGQHADERNDIHCTYSNLSCTNDDRTISQTDLSTNKDCEREGGKY